MTTNVEMVGRALLRATHSLTLADIMTRTGLAKMPAAAALHALLKSGVIDGLPTATRARRFVVSDRAGMIARLQSPGAAPKAKCDFGPLLAALGAL